MDNRYTDPNKQALVQQAIEHAKLLAVKGTRLVIFKNTGKAVYITPHGTKYEASFGLTTNQYLLLTYLAQHPKKVFSARELVKYINPPREGAQYATDDRRVRDTTQAIRQAFKLTHKHKDDLFIVDNGFGIKCDVEIKA